jgi:pyruvate dehydrogenase E2 component (dihydrolipoamide acetyltransferase)
VSGTCSLKLPKPSQMGTPIQPPSSDFSLFGEIEKKPLSRVQQFAAAVLARSYQTIPHVTHHDEADVTDLETLRKALASRHASKITLVSLLIKAVVLALRQFPQFNASLDADGRHLIFKKYFHVGVAVDTPVGLLVPVIRDCDRKTVPTIADELATISAKARSKGLALAEMSGGCFSISSLGSIGGTAFTPIINAPEVAILGVTSTQWKPRRPDDGGDTVSWRQVLPLSLSYDHRVINGADAARFTRYLAQCLQDPQALDV